MPRRRAPDGVRDWLSDLPPGTTGIWVRINAGDLRAADVRAVAAAPALTGLVVAKTETADELVELDRLLTELGSSARVVPLLESAAAVLRAAEIAAAPRVQRIQVGEADLRADLGVTLGDRRARAALCPVPDGAGLDRCQDRAADRAGVHELPRPRRVRGVHRALARLGFVGRACIHPAQVAIANEVFTPSEDRVEWARDVLTRLEAAGSGIATDAQGRMLDEAVARQARLVLSRTRN